MPSPEANSVIIQHVVAVGKVGVLCTQGINIGALCKLDIAIHKVTVRRGGHCATNGGGRHDEEKEKVALSPVVVSCEKYHACIEGKEVGEECGMCECIIGRE